MSERKKGLASARARGRKGSRPGISEDKKEMIKSLYSSKKYTGAEIAKMTDVSRGTVYRVVRKTNKGCH